MSIMTLPDKIELLKNHKEVLFIFEFLGWMHDIGKLDNERFINHRVRGLLDFGLDTLSSYRGHEILHSEKGVLPPDILKNFLGKNITEIILSDSPIKNWLMIKIKKRDYDIIIGSILCNHQSRIITKVPNSSPWCVFQQIFHFGDSLDSQLDRLGLGKNTSPSDRSTWNEMTNPFGHKFLQEISSEQLTNKRQELYNKIAEVGEFNIAKREKIKKLFKEGLDIIPADTHDGINDTTLWDHSYMVGAIARIILANSIISPPDSPLSFTPAKKELDKMKFQILAIKYNGYQYITNSYRTVDFVGRTEAIEKLQNESAKFIEEEIWLGTELYRDFKGIYFLIPDLNPEEDKLKKIIKDEFNDLPVPFDVIISNPADKFAIREEYEKILGNEVRPIPDINKLKNKWVNHKENTVICQVCNLNPAEKKDKYNEHICEDCAKLRKEATKNKLDNEHAIFSDEIADKNGRITLVMGNFMNLFDWIAGEQLCRSKRLEAGRFHEKVKNKKINIGDYAPKRLSPSRSRSIWISTEKWINSIIDESFKEIKNKHSKICGNDNKNPDSFQRYRLLMDKPDGLRDAGFEEIKNNNIVKEVYSTDDRISSCDTIFSNNINAGFEIENKKLNFTNNVLIIPFREIYSTPVSFAFLIPTSDMIDISGIIMNKFNSEFSEAKGSLGFFLSTITFPVKMPFYMVFDTMQRFLKFGMSQEGDISFSGNKALIRTKRFGEIDSKDENYALKHLPFKEPIIISNAISTNEAEKIINKGELFSGKENKFITEMCKPDWWETYFDYEFLDSTTRRFDVFLPKSNRRFHDLIGSNGPRPYLQKDFSRITKLWKYLKDYRDMTDTKLRNIETLLSMKCKNWKLDKTDDYKEIWKEFVEDIIYKELQKWPKDEIEQLKDDISSGLFFDCLNIYLKIIKCRVKE